ncbi:MAG: transcription elongation factor GreA [Candidatus Berkelbacteria bacterium Licking1014_7]|uniref:Transcription elongation factor GreA n=1 Tax=Candidatus Berkelbacteria bacterium Licking1014_7 TaxID=2017147 RepID=A0A554LHP1_9BACT|nr:MAG: transcription elongation factor GreA [Candidatus Berkelbacteria bacterium Licking1014_7]
MAKHKITQIGFDKLRQELDYLKNVKRPQVIKRIADAREMGDLSENSDYDDARDEQSFLEGKIKNLENQIKNCEIVGQIVKNGEIMIGSKIEVKVNGLKMVFEIVGQNEADPLQGKISDKSPIGSALLGAKPGDEVNVQTPKGIVKYQVLGVE